MGERLRLQRRDGQKVPDHHRRRGRARAKGKKNDKVMAVTMQQARLLFIFPQKNATFFLLVRALSFSSSPVRIAATNTNPSPGASVFSLPRFVPRSLFFSPPFFTPSLRLSYLTFRSLRCTLFLVRRPTARFSPVAALNSLALSTRTAHPCFHSFAHFLRFQLMSHLSVKVKKHVSHAYHSPTQSVSLPISLPL